MVDIILRIRRSSGMKIKIPLAAAHLSAQMNLLKWKITNKDPEYSNQSLSHLKFHRFVDDSKARKQLGHQSRPLHETLTDIFNWRKEGGYV